MCSHFLRSTSEQRLPLPDALVQCCILLEELTEEKDPVAKQKNLFIQEQSLKSTHQRCYSSVFQATAVLWHNNRVGGAASRQISTRGLLTVHFRVNRSLWCEMICPCKGCLSDLVMLTSWLYKAMISVKLDKRIWGNSTEAVASNIWQKGHRHIL